MLFLCGSQDVTQKLNELADLAAKEAAVLAQENRSPSEALQRTFKDIDAKKKTWKGYSRLRKWSKRGRFSDSVDELKSTLQSTSATPSVSNSGTQNNQQTPGGPGAYARQYIRQILPTLPPVGPKTSWLTPDQIKALPRVLPGGTQLEVDISPDDSAFSDSGIFSFYRGTMTWRGGKEVVAVKRQTRDHQDKRDMERLDREIKIWWDLSHLNILPAYGWQFWKPDFVDIVMPYVPNKDVATYLPIKEKEKDHVRRFNLVIGLARAIRYLHQNKLVHGFLEPRCVLVGEGDEALLTNFSAAKYIDPENLVIDFTRPAWTKTQQDQYVPPERKQDPPNVGFYSDVWSWGLIGLFIMTGEHPWHGRREADYRALALAGELPDEDRYYYMRPERWDAYPGLWSILESCWIHKADVQARPTMETIVAQLEKYPQPWIV